MFTFASWTYTREENEFDSTKGRNHQGNDELRRRAKGGHEGEAEG